jgi:2-dehydropantoate 2-reductase
MKIAVMGAGAMGSLFGAYLAKAGESVVVVDIWLEHIEAIQTQGLILEEAGGERSVPLTATTEIDICELVDLVILFVKSAATRLAATSAAAILKSDGRVLTLQNGLGNAEAIAEVVGVQRVLVGTTAQGATLLGPGRVRHAGQGDTHIGRLSGELDAFCQEVAAILSNAGLPTFVESDVRSLVWGKLIINTGINALTALLRLRNGQLAELTETRQLLALAVEEALLVAKAAGIHLPYDNPVEKVLSVAIATTDNQSSMLQDILRGVTTEIAVINGAIVREGERLGVATPVNRTLTLLVAALEKNRSNC